MTFRMVRNPAMEKYVLGRVEPFAPLFDVEEIDGVGIPLRIIACGVSAEAAREVIAKETESFGQGAKGSGATAATGRHSGSCV